MSYGSNIDKFIANLDKFGKDLSKNIHVIKYESITPDMFMLCFRTYGKDGNEYYFAALEFDYLNTAKYARDVIKNNFAKVIEFIPPEAKQTGRTELEQNSVYDENQCMRFLLARTERPKGKGYWASYITVMPGDDMAKKLSGLSKDDEILARKTLAEIINAQLPADAEKKSDNFLSSWQQKADRLYLRPEDLKVNDTKLGINIFKNSSGAWEAFYNYVKK
jgi:hypothetical protein